MRAGTLLRLAVAGTRTDTARIALTGVGSTLGTLALLSAATVLAIHSVPDPTDPDAAPMAPYTNGLLRESGLRPGLAIALVLLTIPVLLFVGQCTRVGAPARDRRLAAIRLAGATPRQGLAIVAAEAGVAMLLGTVVGLACYLAGRRLLDAPDAQGLRPLPTDVLPSWGAIAGIVLGLPVIATLVTAFLLRRVTVTPLEVVRRERTGSPRPWPGILIIVGVVTYSALVPFTVRRANSGHVQSAEYLLLVLFLATLAATIGVVGGAGWISYTAGRLMSRYARRPATLIAGRRMQADPWMGSRALAALLASMLFAGGAAWITSSFRVQQQVEAESERLFNLAAGQAAASGSPDDFYLRAMQLVGYAVLIGGLIAAAGLAVALADSVVQRRRALASLTAGGVPRSVLGRALVWQTLAAAVPALVLAVATGVALGRGIASATVTESAGSVQTCTPPPDKADVCNTTDWEARAPYTTTVATPAITEEVPIPWRDLTAILGWAIGATVLTTGLGIAFLRASTAPEELRTT